MKKTHALIMIVSLFTLFWLNTHTALAESGTGAVLGEIIQTSPDESFDDLYGFGKELFFRSIVTGDLSALGQRVTIESPVGQDLLVAGEEIRVLSEIRGDARLAGASVIVSAPVTEDAVIAGGEVFLTRDSVVGDDLWIMAGRVEIAGSVAHNVKIRADKVTILGLIGGDMEIKANTLIFASGAQVNGKVKYAGNIEPVIEQGAIVPDLEFVQTSETWFQPGPFAIYGMIIHILAFLIAALLAQKFLGRTAQTVGQTFYSNFWPSLGIGFMGFIGYVILLILFAFTLIGYFAALILGAWLLLALLMTLIFSAIFVGAWLKKWIKKEPVLRPTYGSTALGVAIISVLSLIPFIGWLVSFVIWFGIFGAILQTIKDQIRTIHMMPSTGGS